MFWDRFVVDQDALVREDWFVFLGIKLICLLKVAGSCRYLGLLAQVPFRF